MFVLRNKGYQSVNHIFEGDFDTLSVDLPLLGLSDREFILLGSLLLSFD